MDLDPNLAFGTPGPITIDAPQPLVCPLGQIVYAGTKWGSRATYAHAKAPGYFRPTPHFLLVYTLEGEADYVDSTGLRTVLRRGDLVWAAPGVEQSYGPRPGSRWSEFYLWLSGPLFDTWHAHAMPGARSRLLSLLPCEFWMGRFAAVVAKPPAGTVDAPLVRLCLLQGILAEAIQHVAGQTTARDAAWLETACRLLEAGTLTTPGLSTIAQRSGISYSLFRKRFLTLTGKTPGQYRAEAIMRRACQRLSQDAASIGSIAADLGFHDQFHFSRRFRQVVGMSPRAFRQST